MMTTPLPMGQMRILNQTATCARLRFRCGGFPIWDTWLDAGSHIAVPSLADKDISASIVLLDPQTGVAYTVPLTNIGRCVRLVATKEFFDGAGSFQVKPEPFDRSGQIGLLNLTAVDLHCALRFQNSPFMLNTVVAAYAEQVLALASLDLSATVDGITVAAVPIKTWSSDVVIGTDYLDGKKYPQLNISAHEPNGYHALRSAT